MILETAAMPTRLFIKKKRVLHAYIIALNFEEKIIFCKKVTFYRRGSEIYQTCKNQYKIW